MTQEASLQSFRPCVQTWPRFRFAQRDFKGKWQVAPSLPDKQLSALGYRLGGPYRNAKYLDDFEQRELHGLIALSKDAQTDEQRSREAELLARCPFSGPLPPLDIDVVLGTASDYVRAQARELHVSCLALGAAAPRWHLTGGKGLHGDSVAPDGVESTVLLRAYGDFARAAAAQSGTPLLSEHRHKANRPPIVLDDTLFEREADARGVVWRLSGSTREEGGKKVPVELMDRQDEGLPAQPEFFPKLVKDYALQLRLTEGWGEELSAEDLARALLEPGEKRFVEARRAKKRVHVERERVSGRFAPLDLGPSVAALKHVAKALIRHDPGRGARHDLRLAVAGWLLTALVPERVVLATLLPICDAHGAIDAERVVRTTAARVRSGERFHSFGRVQQMLGEVAAHDLRTALEFDLADAGVSTDLSKRLTSEDRATLRSAAELASTKWHDQVDNLNRFHGLKLKLTGKGGPHATNLRRAAKCGYARQRGECEGCGKGEQARWISAENFLCPHCAAKWARSAHDWLANHWPEQKIYLAVRKLEDDSYAAALAYRKHVLSHMRKKTAGPIRFLLAPGYVAVLCMEVYSSGVVRSVEELGDDMQEHSIEDVLLRLEPLLNARARRLKQFLATKNLEKLATDEWVTRVVTTFAGKRARAAFPWPKKEDLRAQTLERMRAKLKQTPLSPEEAKKEAAIPLHERRTNCCNAHRVFKLLSAKGDVVASRRDVPWTADEAYHHMRNYERDGTVLGKGLPTCDWEDVPSPWERRAA